MSRILAATLLVASLVSLAAASVGPPVLVRPVDLPEVRPGAVQDFAVEIVSPESLPIDDLKVEGEGWTIVSIEAPETIDLQPDVPVTVRFRAVARDPGQLVRVSFYVGPELFTQELDYSDRARRRGQRSEFAGGAQPTIAPADADAPPVALQRSARNIQVFGRWYTTRPDGVTEVIPSARVELWEDDVDPNPDDFIAETFTNSGGAYQFDIFWDAVSEAQPDLYVVVWFENSAVRVQDLNGSLYGYRTPTEWNYTGTSLNFGTYYPASGFEEVGFIFNRIERGHGILWTDGSGDNLWSTPKVNVQWTPTSTAGSSYGSDLIRIRGNHGFREYEILHEWGHHWMAKFGVYPGGRTYCNGQCDANQSTGDCGHCLWCNEDLGNTLTEGFANYMGELLALGISSRWGTSIFDNHPEARMEYYETTIVNSLQCSSGHQVDPTLCEGNFAALLRDISDSQNDNDPNWGPGTDAMNQGYEDVLETFDLRAPVNAMDFLAQFVDRYPSTASALGNAAQNNGYAVGTTRPNLAPFTPSGWASPVVPRASGTATLGSVTSQVELYGNEPRTYLNVSVINSGGFPTADGFSYVNQIDGVTDFTISSGKLTNGFFSYFLNGGPRTVKGGRHTYSVIADANGDIAEGTETDNDFGAQWIWTPMTLIAPVEIARTAPPQRYGGSASVPSNVTFYENIDGFRLIDVGSVQGVAIRPDGAADYDLRVYGTASNSSTSGFTTASTTSAVGGSRTDLVLFNYRQVAAADRDLGVLNYSGDAVGFRIEARNASAPLAFGGQASVNWGSGDVLYVGEVLTPAGVDGWAYLEVGGPVGSGFEVLWYTPTQGFGTRGNPNQSGAEANGKVRLIRETSGGTYHPFAIVRDRDDGLGPIDLTVRAGRVPADLAAAVLPGSAAAIVPRDSEAVLIPFGDPVPAPTALVGDATRTNQYIHWQNDSPNPSEQYFIRWERNGAPAAEFDFGTAPANSGILWQVAGAFTVPGGRHTLGLFVDSQDGNAELFEDNNRAASQWVWAPQTVPLATPIVRAAPPSRAGGLADVPVGQPTFFNVDGVRTPEFAPSGNDGQWALIALSPGDSTDYDVRIHDPSTGPQDGFVQSLVASVRGAGLNDFVVAHLRNVQQRTFDVGILNYAGSTPYTLQVDASTDLGPSPFDGGLATLGAGLVAKVFEVALPAGETLIRLVHESGDVDWGLSIIPPQATFRSLVSSTTFNGSGAGTGEEVVYDAPAAGRYAIVVFKDDTASTGVNGQYRLKVGDVSTSAPPVPGVIASRLVGAAPNPFNPRTAIAFELAQPGRVELEILDVAGRRVRSLTSQDFAAGRHEVVWNGEDDGGRSVATGVYFVRMNADGVNDRTKIVLIK